MAFMSHAKHMPSNCAPQLPLRTQLLPPHPPTINSQRMPTQIRASPTRQKHHGALEILGRSPAARRNPLTNALQPLGVIQQRLVHVRRNIPRRDTVDGDAARRPLVGKRLCHLRHAALAGRVRRHGDAALERQQAAKVDNRPDAAGGAVRRQRQHVRGHVAAQREGRAEVDLQHLGKVGVREGLRGVAALDAGAVDEDAQLVPVGEDARHEAGDGGGRGEVGRVDVCVAAEGFDGGFGGLVGGVALDVALVRGQVSCGSPSRWNLG